MFRVGQKVVCVDENWRARPYQWEALPKKGEIYTIRQIDCERDGIGVRLHEIHNKLHEYAEGFGEVRFNSSHFRPVVDISDLQAIVREQMLGKPRTIAPDKFDKQRIHSATPRADASATPAASGTAAGSPPKESAAHIAERKEANAASGPTTGSSPIFRVGRVAAVQSATPIPDALAMPPRLERETPAAEV
jgi:hypothetical protein